MRTYKFLSEIFGIKGNMTRRDMFKMTFTAFFFSFLSQGSTCYQNVKTKPKTQNLQRCAKLPEGKIQPLEHYSLDGCLLGSCFEQPDMNSELKAAKTHAPVPVILALA